mgnify:CR=1 FL=1
MDNNIQFITCPNCGKTVNATHSSCWNCGMIYHQQAVQQPQQVYYQQQPGYNPQNSQQYTATTMYQPQANVEIISPTVNNIIGMIIALLGLIGCMISVFLPFMSANGFGYSDSKNLFDNSVDAFIILFLCIIDIIVVLCRCKTYGIDTIVSGFILLYFGGFHFVDIRKKISSIGYYGSIVKVGAGVYVLIICSILVIAGGFTLFAAQYNKKKFGR